MIKPAAIDFAAGFCIQSSGSRIGETDKKEITEFSVISFVTPTGFKPVTF